MDIQDIRYIIAIIDYKTMSKAAQSLYISQSALSQSIQRIEAQIGMPLFHRSSRSLTPTAICNRIVQEGRKLLQEYDYMMTGISEIAHANGTPAQEVLHFGISPFYSKYYLPGFLRIFRERYPNTKLEIIEKISVNLEADVLDGKLDCCFVPAYPANPNLDYHTISTEEIFLAIPKENPINSFAKPSKSIPMLDITLTRYEPYILQPHEQKISSMQERIFTFAGFSPYTIYQTTNWDTILSLTDSGIGLSLLPDIFLHYSLLRCKPNYYRILGIDTTRAYAAAFRHGNIITSGIENLINVMEENLYLLKSKSNYNALP